MEFGLDPIEVSLKWTGPRGPVLTGDSTKFAMVVNNKNRAQKVEGSVRLVGLLTSPFTGQGARPTNSIPFAIGPGGKEKFPVPDHWMYVEGKWSWVMVGLTPKGQTEKSVEHPLASLTVFERSTYKSQTRVSWATLMIAAVAAVGSGLAAVFGYLLLK
jgi:hypothetical protein